MSKFNNDKLNKLKAIDSIWRFFYLRPINNEPKEPIDKNSVQEIVIMAMMMLGDTIMLIPSLKSLKKQFPKASITLICGTATKAILDDRNLADKYVIVKSPWMFHDYSIKNLLQLINSVRIANLNKYDLAIDFRGDWRNIFLMNFIKAKRKISFNYSGGEYMLTDVIAPNENKIHYIDEWLYLTEQLGCVVNEEDRYPHLNLNEHDKKYLADFKTQHALYDKLVIGIHPGASVADRKWQESKYADLIIRLAQTYKNCMFVLFQGPGEDETIHKILDIIVPMNIKNVIVNVGLQKYLVLLNSCELLICNDSGAGHIAAAFNIPSVVIFGKSDPATIKPLNKNFIKLISHRDKIKPEQNKSNGDYLALVTTDEVYTATIGIINDIKSDSNNYMVTHKTSTDV